MTTLPSTSVTLETRVITPHAGLDAFKDAVASLISGFGQARQLAWRLFVRDTRADHRQSLLGYFWLVLPALANTMTWVFLNNVPYPLFVLSGIILWTAFNGSIMSMLGVISSARAFLGKVNFPHESLIYSAILKSALDAILAALVLIPALLLFADHFRPESFLFLAALVASIVAGSAIGLLILPVAGLYNDVSRGIQLILRFAFFLAPIIFALPSSGAARRIMLLNPVTPIITTGRDWLTGSGEGMPTGFAIVLVASTALITSGLIIYKVALPHLIERVGS
jgi:lipopolysaccharide transport system permease protein